MKFYLRGFVSVNNETIQVEKWITADSLEDAEGEWWLEAQCCSPVETVDLANSFITLRMVEICDVWHQITSN